MSKIVFKNKNFVVLNKAAGMSSQPDNTSGEDAITYICGILSSLSESTELYPVHRLDKVVGGLLVFARNKSWAKALGASISDGELNKEYLAVVEGNPGVGVMKDFLVKNSTLGKAETVNEGRADAKFAELEYRTLETVRNEKGEKSLVKIILKSGRFHQIRIQFSSRGYPLSGDKKYGSPDHRSKMPALFAYKLGINTDGYNRIFKELPNISRYPWNLFGEETYRGVM